MKNRKWMPITAGVLDILHGIGGIILSLIGMFFLGLEGSYWEYEIPAMLWIPGLLSIIGGIYSFKRKKWRVALAGAIVSILPPIILNNPWYFFPPYNLFSPSNLIGFVITFPAILAIVLTVLSRKQFNKNSLTCN
jgi:hypothetical protein